MRFLQQQAHRAERFPSFPPAPTSHSSPHTPCSSPGCHRAAHQANLTREGPKFTNQFGADCEQKAVVKWKSQQVAGFLHEHAPSSARLQVQPQASLSCSTSKDKIPPSLSIVRYKDKLRSSGTSHPYHGLVMNDLKATPLPLTTSLLPQRDLLLAATTAKPTKRLCTVSVSPKTKLV